MATDMDKIMRIGEIEGLTIFGLAMSLWELFGESSFATSNSIGDLLLPRMENETGLKFQGNDIPANITELTHLFCDELGMIKSANPVIEGDMIHYVSNGCTFGEGCNKMQSAGVKPFYCPMFNITCAALRSRMGKRNRFAGCKWEAESQTCTLDIQLF